MKSLKCKTLAAILGIVWLGWFSVGCDMDSESGYNSANIEGLDGKIVKDSDGNYYVLDHKYANVVRVIETNVNFPF